IEHLLLELRNQARVVFLQVNRLAFRCLIDIRGYRRALLEDIFDRLHENIRLDGLHDETIRAEAHAEGGVLGVGISGRVKDEWDKPRLVAAFELAAELEAVHSRHEDIRDDQIVIVALGKVKRVNAVAGGINLVAVTAEQGLEHVQILGLVIDTKDFHGCSAAGERKRPMSLRNDSVEMGFSMYPTKPSSIALSRSPSIA